MDKASLDCPVIGAGPAGLTAAIYLARFRRHFLVVDSGASCAALIPVSHNLAGFPQGIAGTKVLQQVSEQARKYGAQIVPGNVNALARDADGMFAATLGNQMVRARTILMATGVVDGHPDFPDLQEAIHCGLVLLKGAGFTTQILDLIGGRGPGSIASQPPFPGFQKLLRPEILLALCNAFPAAKLSNAVFTARAFKHDPDFIFS